MPVVRTRHDPIGSAAGMVSLRLNGATLACFVPSGLKAIRGTLRWAARRSARRPSANHPAEGSCPDVWRGPYRADPDELMVAEVERA
jgi:hypothetical protein